ncbi:uncharacterized protein AB675_1296 [Cyphellophora attinorum]|uniref:Heterokaryon incompatibility domain-containing protein n=1 Tax=Cyphellophora attinorum TaxID=1664694 RepID=A0A0N1NYB0_9EURO|nr:uncharacterized protein AB675_1296 [Phialophora attinorum]KPI35740.1 hypothetical protein AB675_1296 [Phialophora attinorum]
MSSDLYQALKEDDSIRLLTLLPGSRGSPISCRLEEVRLSSKPEYMALSYTWGEPVLTNTISINGVSKGVRHNLYTALQYLRDTAQAQMLWIDALTINQDNIPERNQQVKLMNQIYEKSSRTVVWLREEKDSDRPALDLLHLCDLLENDDAISINEKYRCVADAIFWPETSTSDVIIDSLAGIFASDWFSRTWIIQEFTLPSQVILRCGDSTFRKEGLSLLCEAQNSPPADWAGLMQPLKQVIPLNTLRRMFWQERKLLSERQKLGGLGFLLHTTCRRFDTSEPRDCVYALLSLVNTPGSVLTPDYHLTTAQVFSAATRVSSEPSKLEVFYLLALSCRRPFSTLKQSLPSWVPDFSHRGPTHGRSLQKFNDIYCAGGKTSPAFSFSDDELTLTLKGKILDSVSTVLIGESPDKFESGFIKQWYGICSDFVNQSVNESGCYPSGESAQECWWRLAICDVHISLHKKYSRASSGFGSSYLDEAISDGAIMDESHLAEEPLRTRQVEYGLALDVLFSTAALCRTRKGYLGWVSPSAREDDIVCLFQGAAAPWLIRPRPDGTFLLISEAYIHGIMYGEALDWDDADWEDIRLS